MTGINISWTQLRAHTECKQKSHLLRTGHRNPAADIRSWFHGLVVDRVMRAWLMNPVAGAMPDMVGPMIDQCEHTARIEGDGIVRWKTPTDRADLRAFCIELVTRLEPILRQLVLPHRFQTALNFRAPIIVPYLDGSPTTVTLIGEMDLLVTEAPNQYAVWDLKGTRDNSYWRKVLGQLIFYDLAVLATEQHPTTRVGFIQPMCTQPVLEFAVTNDQRRQLWAAILAMAGDIWRQDTTCRPTTDKCGWCAVNHACPRYQPTGTTLSFGAELRRAAAETQP